jgi:hypothetical protein
MLSVFMLNAVVLCVIMPNVLTPTGDKHASLFRRVVGDEKSFVMLTKGRHKNVSGLQKKVLKCAKNIFVASKNN